MSTQVQYRRGTTAENNAFTGALAEMTIDTTSGTIRVHDGVTAGGSNIATVAYVTAQIGSLSANSISSGTSNVKLVSSGGNATISIGGTANVAVFSTGGLTLGAGNLTVGNIVNNGSNAAGNIGSSSNYFNTIFAKATSAQYADLAEMYVADQHYEPGTVLEFGGAHEVLASQSSHSTKVAGIVSTNPSYLMNAAQPGDNVLAVALVGRVPCQVIGSIAKGDRLVASDIPGVATVLNLTNYQPGCIIGKALEEYNSDNIGTIEVAVGRN
jgi:hypothetical protein